MSNLNHQVSPHATVGLCTTDWHSVENAFPLFYAAGEYLAQHEGEVIDFNTLPNNQVLQILVWDMNPTGPQRKRIRHQIDSLAEKVHPGITTPPQPQTPKTKHRKGINHYLKPMLQKDIKENHMFGYQKHAQDKGRNTTRYMHGNNHWRPKKKFRPEGYYSKTRIETIAKATGNGTTATKHHLKRLQEFGYIRKLGRGYPQGKFKTSLWHIATTPTQVLKFRRKYHEFDSKY